MGDTLFAGLLRYWRTRRGLSQLDLSVAADVSARHVSWLETGRSRPGREMVLRLMTVLDVPLRAVDEALEAAGFEPLSGNGDVPLPVDRAVERMLTAHEPFPLTVLDPGYTIVRANAAAGDLLRLVAPGAAPPGELAMADLVFAPDLARRSVRDWPDVARSVLSRWYREALRTGDQRVWAAIHRALAHPDVPEEWCRPDLSRPPAATLELWFDTVRGPLGFLTALTTFSGPGSVAVEEIRLESWFPLDDVTEQTLRVELG